MSSVYERLPFPLTHGNLLKNSSTSASPPLPLPECTFDGTNQLSRPDMKNNTRVTKCEFQDSIEVLSAKADIFIDIMKRSKNFSILMGAGISAPLINDYASAKRGDQPQQRLTVAFCNSLRPTPAQRVLAALVNERHIPNLLDVLQQNHDGLLNLAGIGRHLDGGVKGKVNEIHGAWKDRSRPVIPMDGSLPMDLFERMLEQEKKQDCCFTIGTSLSGLNADRLIATANKKGCNAKKYPDQLGGIILSIQQVPQEYEENCALRIYSTCDRWMLLLAAKLNLNIAWDTDFDYDTEQPVKYPESSRHRTTIEGIQMLQQFKHFLSSKNNNNNNTNDRDAAAFSSSSSTTMVPKRAGNNTNNNHVQQDAAVQNSATSSSIPSFVLHVGNRHTVKTSQDGEQTTNSHEWTMVVRSSEKNIIKSVNFILHPTFNPPTVRVQNPTPAPDNRYPNAEEFTLTRLGWGTFEVQCEIEFYPNVVGNNNNNNAPTYRHNLQFDKDEELNLVMEQK